MKGKIAKGIAGFYYVYADDGVLYECKAKGIFRKDSLKPLVGDYVEMSVLCNDRSHPEGSITDILERRNLLIRPNVANVDQALIIFALTSPEPNFVTLDKMILQYLSQGVPVVICFNKEDLVSGGNADRVLEDYADCGCEVIITSAANGEGVDDVRRVLEGKTTTVAGPSGVGKSTIVNMLQSDVRMETGDISAKLERGKHTTRHSQIIRISENTYIIDTPGFGSFDLLNIKPEELAGYYEEFSNDEACRFMPCSHIHEPGCRVKEAVEEGRISKLRYDNYVYIYNELNKNRRY